MRHLRRIILKFYSLIASSEAETELQREIAAHLTLMEDEFVSKGMTPEEARREARLAYGGVEQAKQLHRNERSYPGLAQTEQDISLYSPPITQVAGIYCHRRGDAGNRH
jgi:hypothetical protein